MKDLWVLGFWVAALGAPIGVSAQTMPTGHVRIEEVSVLLQFGADGSLTQTTRWVREAQTEQGAQQLTKHIAGYNGALEKLDIVEAYTLKKSGQKLTVADDGISTQKGMVSAGLGVTLADWQVQQITFPGLAAGDKTVLQLKQTNKKPPLAGWQSFNDFLWPAIDLQKGYWRIEAPENLKLHIDSTMPQSTAAQSLNGLRVWEFAGTIKGRPIDQSPVSSRVAVPRLLVSTLGSHEAVGTLFTQQVQAKALATPEIEQLAAQITSGLADEQQKARAIYDWVRKNFKYAAIYLGNGGWEPRTTNEILKTRYGDCKDHVTLMYALLKAAGVTAQPVLVSTNAEFVRDAIPTAQSYNHTLVYIPSLNKYLDSTATETPYEGIVLATVAKPVVRSDAVSATLDRMPGYGSADNRVHVVTRAHIRSDGSAHLRIEQQFHGVSARVVQDRLANYQAQFEASEVNRALTSSGWVGTGRFEPGAVERDRLQQTLTWDLTVKNFLLDPEAGAVAAHPGLNTQANIAQMIGGWTPERREFDANCQSYTAQEEFEVRFDDDLQILRMPKSVDVTILGVSFKASLVQQGQTIVGRRHLQFDNESAVCSPQEYARRRGAMIEINRQVRSPVLYSKRAS